jgi:hypothetical protein
MTENFVCVPITDLVSTVSHVESKLYLARRSGQVAEVDKLELILLNLKNLRASHAWRE